MYLHVTNFLDLPTFLLRPTESLSGLWALVVDRVLEATVFSVAEPQQERSVFRKDFGL